MNVGTPWASAARSLRRTGSFSAKSRDCADPGWAPGHCGPMHTSTASHDSAPVSIALTKSAPAGILSASTNRSTSSPAALSTGGRARTNPAVSWRG